MELALPCSSADRVPYLDRTLEPARCTVSSARSEGPLTVTRRVGLAAAALTLSLVGCATAFPVDNPYEGGTASTTIRLDVENRNFYDATIYVIEDQGPARRVGDVVGNGTRSFQVRWESAAAMSFRIDLLAGGSCTTPPVVVSPGEVLGLQIVSNVEASSAYCR